jgi:hypothetical protein
VTKPAPPADEPAAPKRRRAPAKPKPAPAADGAEPAPPKRRAPARRKTAKTADEGDEQTGSPPPLDDGVESAA